MAEWSEVDGVVSENGHYVRSIPGLRILKVAMVRIVPITPGNEVLCPRFLVRRSRRD